MSKKQKQTEMTVQEFSEHMKQAIEHLAETDIERAKEYIFKLDPNIGIRVLIEKIERLSQEDDTQDFLKPPK